MAAPYIFLHGFAQTPRSWDAVATALRARGHRVFAPDLLGDGGMAHAASDGQGDGEIPVGQGPCPCRSTRERSLVDGKGMALALQGVSPEPDALQSMDAVCERIAALVRQVAAEEGPPVLVGYSMGGRLAAETLVYHPSLPLAGLLLESVGLGPADEASRAALAERNGAWAARLRDEGVDSFMDWWETLPLFASQRNLPAETRAALRAERTAHTPSALAQSLEAWGAHRQTTEAETLTALVQAHDQGLPVLYVAGVLDQKYAAIAARADAAGLPTVLVPHAGHNVHLEQPEKFLEIMTHKLPLLC